MSNNIKITTELRGEILACAARIFDPESFNKLITSIPSTLAKGRLRFWQEEFLGQLSRELNLFLSMPDFVSVFQDAQLRQVPRIAIAKEEFLQTPIKFLYSAKPYDIPSEWVVEALRTDHVFWENYSYEFVREASKNGKLECLQTNLEWCAKNLPIQQIVELYIRIRNAAILRESEFRPTFEKIYGDQMSQFPAILRRSEVVEILGPEGAEFCEARGYLDHIPH